MNSLGLRFMLLLIVVLTFGAVSTAQVLVEGFETDAPGAFPASWTQLEGSVGYAYVTTSPVAHGFGAVRLSAGVGTASRIKHLTSIPSGDFTYEYYVLIPDSGNTNETIGMVTVENVGMSFATGNTLAEGSIFFSDHADGWTVPTNTWHKVFVEFDAANNVFQVTLNDTASKKYSKSESTSYELRLEATSLSSSLQKHILYVDSVTVTAVTVDLTPSQVFLSNPAEGTTNVGLSSVPSVSWSSVSAATGYQIQIGTDATFAGGIAYDDTTLTGTSKSVPFPPLAPATDYYWRMRAKNSTGWGDWSEVRSFRSADPPAAPTLSGPGDGSYHGSTNDVYLYWSNPSGSQVRQIQVATDALFTDVVVNDSATTNSSYQYVSFPPLQTQMTYYWRVRSLGVAGWGEWSEVRSFQTPVAPAAPVLSSPADNDVRYDETSTSLSWSNVSGAEGYHVQVATDTNFTNIVVYDSTTGQYSASKSIAYPPLQYNTKYYWRVRSKNFVGNGEYSVIRVFYTLPLPEITLGGPADHSTLTNNSTSFYGSVVWPNSADTFRVQIATDVAFSQVVVDTASTSSSISIPISSFTAGTMYYWRMQAWNVAGWGPFSAPWDFTIWDLATAPALDAPLDGAHTTTFPVGVNWNSGAATGVSLYQLQIALDDQFTSIVHDTTLTSSFLNMNTPPLQIDTRYYWRVRSMTNVGWSPYSAVWSFYTPGPPPAPVITSPAAGTTDLVGTITISWTGNLSADSTIVEIMNDTSFVTARVVGGTSTQTEHRVLTAARGSYYSSVDLNVNAFAPGEVVYITAYQKNSYGAGDRAPYVQCTVIGNPPPPMILYPHHNQTLPSFLNVQLQATGNATIFTETSHPNAYDAATMHARLFRVTDYATNSTTVVRDEQMSRPYYSEWFDPFTLFVEEFLPSSLYFLEVTTFNGIGNETSEPIAFRTPLAEPQLCGVLDVEGDQGSFCTLDFLASPLEHPNCGSNNVSESIGGVCVEQYSIVRGHDPTTLPNWDVLRIAKLVEALPSKVRNAMSTLSADYVWEPLMHFPAIGQERYIVTVRTLRDARPNDPHDENFAVIAHLSNGLVFFSNVMTGHSIDNLAPAPPTGGSAVLDNGSVRLAWQANAEKDLKEYIVYRSLVPNDDISTLTPIGTTPEPTFTDQNPPSVPVAYYYVVGKDKNENEGDPAVIAASIVTGVEVLQGVPTEYSLSQNYPNPFNPTTNIRFGIPQESHVRIQVINTIGQIVDEITDTDLPAGYFQVTWNANVPSGLYIYRIVAEAADGSGQAFTQIRKMVLLR